MLEVATAMPPLSEYSEALETAGVADLASIGGVVGFGTKGIIERNFANFKDQPKGVFELVSGKPLTAGDPEACAQHRRDGRGLATRSGTRLPTGIRRREQGGCRGDRKVQVDGQWTCCKASAFASKKTCSAR